jgi:uncharacterized protein YciI
MPSDVKPHVRYVIIHTPGPNWVMGVDLGDQDGVEDHVRHYRTIHEAGKLELGGPFLTTDTGGMMIPVSSLGEDEVRQIAQSDPAVASGLLEVEVRPWYVAMSRSA